MGLLKEQPAFLNLEPCLQIRVLVLFVLLRQGLLVKPKLALNSISF